MLAEYNSYLGKNVKYSDVFSERNIKNWEAFNQIFEDVESLKDISSLDSLKLNISLGQFLIFYEDYKNWLSAYEIFEVLDNDITSYGNKSFYHGKPDNPDVFIMDFDDYHEYYEKITKFFSLNNKKPKKLRKAKATDETSPEYISMQTIIDFINKLEERVGYANTHLMEIGSIWSRLEYHFSHMSDGDFEVTQIYVHKNEILSLISAMLTFPELHELANQISLKFLGKNVELIENKTKENT